MWCIVYLLWKARADLVMKPTKYDESLTPSGRKNALFEKIIQNILHDSLRMLFQIVAKPMYEVLVFLRYGFFKINHQMSHPCVRKGLRKKIENQKKVSFGLWRLPIGFTKFLTRNIDMLTKGKRLLLLSFLYRAKERFDF